MFNRVIRGYTIKHYCSIGYRRGDRINLTEEWILLKDHRKQNATPCISYYLVLRIIIIYTRRECYKHACECDRWTFDNDRFGATVSTLLHALRYLMSFHDGVT